MRSLAAILAVLIPATVSADPSSGVDTALFRGSYDTGGLFSLEGARLMPVHDLSFKVLGGYGRSPLDVAVPGIGDGGKDKVLDYVATIDMAFGMTLAERIAIGFDVAGYRTATGAGYGARGRFGFGGKVAKPSTGLIALRPLSNIDPSASPTDPNAYLGDGLAGPLDVHAGLKVELYRDQHYALTAIGSVFLPFGDDEMLLGDRNLVFEPKVAFDWRADRVSNTRVLANVAARIRERTILQSYDTTDATMTDANAKAFLDVGSEVVVGLGGAYELNPRLTGVVEAQVFLPITAASYGGCLVYDGRACSALTDVDYVGGKAKRGDLTSLATAGLMVRVTSDVSADLAFGTGLGGARGDDFRITTGIAWAPQPAGQASTGRRDRDGDGIPDSVDACPEEPEDKDGFEDEDGCPELDNDGDGIPDAIDKCPDQPEDKDGFEDEDGCPDEDNDGDGFADAVDKCPNEPETVNGFEDDDGCPDVRGTTGPEERADRIDLKGAQIAFGKGNAILSAPAKQVLTQVAGIIKGRRLAIRIEVHVPLGIKSTNAAQIAAQKKKDKALAQLRAKAIVDYLVTQNVATAQLQGVGIGADRPLGTTAPTDAVNERVELIKSQQGGTP